MKIDERSIEKLNRVTRTSLGNFRIFFYSHRFFITEIGTNRFAALTAGHASFFPLRRGSEGLRVN